MGQRRLTLKPHFLEYENDSETVPESLLRILQGKKIMNAGGRRVIVIGGGASGLMAAISAARHGAYVTLLEKNKQIGKKLLATGNGRCNFTNRNQDLSHYRTGDPRAVAAALKAYSMPDTVAFFEQLGILIKDKNGYLYPGSGQASSVAELLRLEAVRQNVKLKCNTEVQRIEKCQDAFLVKTEGWSYEADAVILSCGSMAAPETGSTGDGYRFAEEMEHTVIKPLPALTGLYAGEKDCRKLSGVRADAKAILFVDGSFCAEDEGEVQFASYGLSGIPIFQISRFASRALDEGHRCEVVLDLWETHTPEQIIRILKDRQKYTGERKGTETLLGMFPEKLSAALLDRAGVSLKKRYGDWTDEECGRLARQIKEMRFTVTRCRGYEQAQVCTGGVPLTELKGISMESALVPGLYLTGELLDVDGACGGYNLQWAWTSGYLAGFHAAAPQRAADWRE